jgi:hypothetical protein
MGSVWLTSKTGAAAKLTPCLIRSVPANRGHDDLLISTALTARLDAMDWRDRMARGTAGI